MNVIRLFDKRCAVAILGGAATVLILLAFLAGIAQASLLPQSLYGVGQFDPEEQATTLSAALLAADSVAHVERLLHQTLELIGIGVYDIYGTPLAVGNETSADDFFLYDFEVRLVAESFLKKKYLSLEAIVESWRSMGIPIVPLGKQVPQLVCALEVEKGLRALRRAAEEEPEHLSGFIVRLIDELGNREEFPFDLLDDEDDEPVIEGLAFGLREMVQEQLALIRKDALADGDQEMLARLEILESEAGQRLLIEAMLEGDLFRIMQLLMGEESIAELAEEMREMERDLRGDEEATAEITQFVGSTARFFAGQELDFVQANIDFLQDEVERLATEREKILRDAREEIASAYRGIRELPATYVASAVLNADSLAFVTTLELDFAEDQRVYLANIVEPWAEEYEDMKQLQEEMKRQGGLPVVDDQQVSPLHLDPIQTLLLHIDMFLEPRQLEPEAVHSTWLLEGIQVLRAKLQPRVLAGSSSFGNAGGRFADAYGALNSVLSTANSVRSVMRDIRNVGIKQSYAGAAKSIVRGAIQTAATEIHVDVYYVIERRAVKAGPENPGASIHMRHGEPRRERYIRLEARLESPFLDALSEVVAQADPYRAIGPIATFLELPDPLANLRDIADHDFSNVDVRFQPDSEFLARFLLAAPESGVGRGTVYTKKTGDDGKVNSIFYLNKETPDVGGWTETTPGAVRVQAMVNASEKAMYNPAAWGLAVGEEISRPVQAYVQLRVEHHIPVERTGTLSLVRTVTETGSAAQSDAEGASELSRNGTARLELTVTQLTMDKEGQMTADYRATLSGNWRHTHTVTHFGTDAEGSSTKTVRDTTETAQFVGRASGTSTGVEFLVDSRGNTYLVWPGPLLAELAYALTMDGTITERTVVTDEDGPREPAPPKRESISHTGQLAEFITALIFDHQALYIYPRPEFKRTYDLVDIVTVPTRPIPSSQILPLLGANAPSFLRTVTTRLDWSLLGSQDTN